MSEAAAPSGRLHLVTVEKAWDETPALRALRLAAPPELARSHARAGQYLKVRSDGRDGIFALASAPGRPLELLVKRGAPAADALAGLGAGAALEVSDVLGPGFPVEEAAGRDLLLFAAGSGITPIRAVVQRVLDGRARFGRVMLFYGQRQPGDFAYAGERAAWAAAEVELVPVVSGGAAEWAGARGHVQEALLAARPSVERASAFLCGMKAMVAGVTAALGSLGLARERIHLNF